MARHASTGEAGMTESFLSIKHVSKSYGGIHALQDVSFSVPSGHVRALLGENGAGKSTLIRILAGTTSADQGTIALSGEERTFSTPLEALDAGIVTIYQEFNLVPQLTVAENIFLGWLPTRAGWVNRHDIRKRAAGILDRIGARISPDIRVGDLNVAGQQMVEIAKALARNVKVLLMDEPTAALNDAEIEALFRIIRSLKEDGVAIVYVSHRMAEIFAIADSVTVLKDGRHVGTEPIGAVTTEMLVRMMIGRTLDEFYPSKGSDFGGAAFEVRGLRISRLLHVDHLMVRKGEVLGIVGLEGQGQSELVQAIAGARPCETGNFAVDGTLVRIRSTRDAVAAGIGYIPDDRKHDGLALIRTSGENLAIGSLRHRQRFGVVSRVAERSFIDRMVSALKIKLTGPDQRASDLSGGNQQKLVFGKALGFAPKVLVMAAPTRGVDVGAKREIYEIIRDLTRSGTGVIMLSGELPEVLGMCDRVLVMTNGRIVAEMGPTEMSEETIMTAATAATPEATTAEEAA
jgi:ribose transport system ATP-binding protein